MSIEEIALAEEHHVLTGSQSTSSITVMVEDIEVEPFTDHEFPPVSFQ